MQLDRVIYGEFWLWNTPRNHFFCEINYIFLPKKSNSHYLDSIKSNNLCARYYQLAIALISKQTFTKYLTSSIIAARVRSNDNFILFFQFMVSTKLMEILVKLFLPFSHRHSLLEMGQIQFHPGVLLWNLEQLFTFVSVFSNWKSMDFHLGGHPL